MTHDDIIRMAREAGAGVALTLASNPRIACAEFRGGALERFAALVAAAEREACAKVCDPDPMSSMSESIIGEQLAARTTHKDEG